MSNNNDPNDNLNNLEAKEFDSGSEKAFNDLASETSSTSDNGFDNINFESIINEAKESSLTPKNSPLLKQSKETNSPLSAKNIEYNNNIKNIKKKETAINNNDVYSKKIDEDPYPLIKNNDQIENVHSVQSFSIKPYEMPKYLSRKPSLPRDKLKNCLNIIKKLKHHSDAYLFLEPVDYKALKLPDYPTIVKNPMDLSTIENKLNDCGYETINEFILDVNLIFQNCYLYNGVDSYPSRQAKNLETEFKKLLRSQEQNTQKLTYQLPEDSKKSKGGKGKTYGKPISRNNSYSHSTSSTIKKPKNHNNRINEIQLRHCLNIVKELFKKTHYAYSFPFLQPVDWVTLNIPDYPRIVKHPMDLKTIKDKLEAQKYKKASEFEEDIRLMFNNCYLYNPPTNPVHMMGKKFEDIFNRKWDQRPKTPPLSPKIDDGLSSDENDIISDKDREIAMLKKKLSLLQKECEMLRANEQRNNISNLSKQSLQTENHNVNNGNKSQSKPKKKPSIQQNKKEEIPIVSLEQKKELSEKFNELEQNQIEMVFEIIKSGMPHLQANDEDEIELDIDSLDKKTLWTLYDYVINTCINKNSSNNNKRQFGSISGHEEDNQIAELEKKLKRFENVDQNNSISEYNNIDNDESKNQNSLESQQTNGNNNKEQP